MRVLGLTALIRQRQFEASKTMEKRYTDLPFQQAAKNSIYYSF